MTVAVSTVDMAARPTISVCTSCYGAEALLTDLEELAGYAGVRVRGSGCMGACGCGPNVVVETPPATGGAAAAASKQGGYEMVCCC